MAALARYRPRRNGRALCRVLVAGILLSGCASLPRSGPSTAEIEDSVKEPNNPLGVHLIKLSPQVVQEIGRLPRASLGAIDRLASGRRVDTIGPGDVLSISVYEAGPGLFTDTSHAAAASGTTAETLPRVQVDRAGRIEFPFAGMIEVAGHTTSEVQKIIEDRLADKATQPQVLVSVVSGDTNSMIVSGDVKNPGRRPLTLAGENLLDVIALSGGVAHDPADTLVKVTRSGRSAELPLTTIEANPAENIRIQPQDRVLVSFNPRTFLVFGATGRVAEVPFDHARVTLAEAMARAGGLDDNRANPSSVYVFRFEAPVVADLLHLAPSAAAPGPIPVIFQADLRDPQNLFLMQRFDTQDKDLIYVANASTVQLYKLLQLFYTVVTPAVTGRQLTQ